MTSDELDALETAFAIKLPASYRAFMQTYPRRLVDMKVDLGWKTESPSEREFLNDHARLLELNNLVRLPDTPWTDSGGPWPACHFVIGDDECGNYWSLDTDQDSPSVWFYDHDLGEWELAHRSLEDFANWLAAGILDAQ